MQNKVAKSWHLKLNHGAPWPCYMWYDHKISDVFIITVYSRPKYSYMLQIMSFALEIYHLLIYSWLLVPSYKTYIVEAYYKTEDDFYLLGNILLLKITICKLMCKAIQTSFYISSWYAMKSQNVSFPYLFE